MFTMQSARPLAIRMIKALASNWESGCLVFWVSFQYSISFRRSFSSHSRMIDVLKWSIQYPINWTMWGWFNLTKNQAPLKKMDLALVPQNSSRFWEHIYNLQFWSQSLAHDHLHVHISFEQFELLKDQCEGTQATLACRMWSCLTSLHPIEIDSQHLIFV